MPSVSWLEVARLVGAPEDSPAGAQLLEIAEQFLAAGLPLKVQAAALKLLAAHLWTVLEPKISSEAAGGVSVSYALPALGDGLSATVWGMQYRALVELYAPTTPIVL